MYSSSFRRINYRDAHARRRYRGHRIATTRLSTSAHGGTKSNERGEGGCWLDEAGTGYPIFRTALRTVTWRHNLLSHAKVDRDPSAPGASHASTTAVAPGDMRTSLCVLRLLRDCRQTLHCWREPTNASTHVSDLKEKFPRGTCLACLGLFLWNVHET
jgi:hypothetical protein